MSPTLPGPGSSEPAPSAPGSPGATGSLSRIMENPRFRLGLLGVVVLFAIGLIGFYAFAADKGDGLEVTMEEGGVTEDEPVWSAPLEYGEDYAGSLVMGLLGFALLLGLTLGYGYLLRWRQSADA